mmetsp:Transcript_6435/g.12203  ORF Transcript_6435/g.12203 Transcript_6435/m.12203 type:complete len:399 (-) Transcript_6435:249-1445(-)|eukprot:CAMPEP_0114249166 /NCGR_PEP_ID=MMETSP0058-20121206/13989_1 /TAXON_ID=36894 /ORGANISM="Pyramimonas parkeae, CCMP726" /LENGTH=398 /DNA_ID=CAMNT_0001362677 /DNA_START=249 /DNA_END=1445 /DNA_ORIENTATION=+
MEWAWALGRRRRRQGSDGDQTNQGDPPGGEARLAGGQWAPSPNCCSAKRVFKNAVAWIVLSLFMYVLLLSSCWVCSVCNDCGPYPSIGQCPDLHSSARQDQGLFAASCLSTGTMQAVGEEFQDASYFYNGHFRCSCCGNPVFPSFAKYQAGSGVPSFWGAAGEQAVDVDKHHPCVHCEAYHEVTCHTCQARLGYVTGDGPEPSGKRYSINSLCVHHSLEPLEVAASEADWDPTAPQTPIDHAHCHAYDPVDTEWHAGNCDPNKAILRHQDTLPEEWIQVSIAAIGSSTLVFAFASIACIFRARANARAAQENGDIDTDEQLAARLNRIRSGDQNSTEREHRSSITYQNVVKVIQPCGEYAIAFQPPSESDDTEDHIDSIVAMDSIDTPEVLEVTTSIQ